MDFLANKEYQDFLKDKMASNSAIEANKYTFIRNLQGEYGKKILTELNDKDKYKLKTSLWSKIKAFFRKRREKALYKKYYKKEGTIAFNKLGLYYTKKGRR